MRGTLDNNTKQFTRRKCFSFNVHCMANSVFTGCMLESSKCDTLLNQVLQLFLSFRLRIPLILFLRYKIKQTLKYLGSAKVMHDN